MSIITEKSNDVKARIKWNGDKDQWLLSAVVTAGNGHQDILYREENQATIEYIKQLEADNERLREDHQKHWVQFAYARLGMVRDNMKPEDVEVVQKFLGPLEDE